MHSAHLRSGARTITRLLGVRSAIPSSYNLTPLGLPSRCALPHSTTIPSVPTKVARRRSPQVASSMSSVTEADKTAAPHAAVDTAELFAGAMPKAEIGAVEFLKVRTGNWYTTPAVISVQSNPG